MNTIILVKRKKPNAHAGITMIEVAIATFISSIVFCSVLTMYGSFIRMTQFQESETELQQQFMQAYHILERDIRFSGYNLPGNGLHPFITSTGNLSFVMLSNETNQNTRLSADAQIGDLTVIVDDCHGVLAKQWICLMHDSMFAYYQIASVGLHQSGTNPDTVRLQDSTISQTWNHLSTTICFATGIHYSVEGSGSRLHLVRHSLKNDIQVGTSIDSICFVPKDSTGTIISSNYSKARTLLITLVSHLKSAAPNTPFVKSFDVNVRNYL